MTNTGWSTDGPNKIDGAATDGLAGVSNSLAYRVEEIERHLHNRERWLGLAASPDAEVHCADDGVMVPIQIDAGNDTWGAWVCILGSGDTPIIAGLAKYDPHELLVDDVQSTKLLTRIQMAYGASGAAALAAGTYSELMMKPDAGAKHVALPMMFPRITAGTKLFARCWVSTENTSTIDFFMGVHEYEG